jgi:hypothetical protein
MKKKPGLTHKDHLNMAYHFHKAKYHLDQMSTILYRGVYKSSKAGKAFYAIHPHGNKFSWLASELDDLYHGVTTDEEFRERGHVYYGDGRKLLEEAEALQSV